MELNLLTQQVSSFLETGDTSEIQILSLSSGSLKTSGERQTKNTYKLKDDHAAKERKSQIRGTKEMGEMSLYFYLV